MQDLVLTPSDFVALLNQTLEFAYPTVTIEGELSDFRISKNRWVYFDLKDELASVKFFGTVYQLPGPLEDGLSVRAVGAPRMHPCWGFSVNLQSLQPVGEGSLKKAANLLRAKLAAEGLFAPERKRPLPQIPARIGLVTAEKSAAAADFIKILDERWGGVEVLLADSSVQGDQAPGQIVQAIEMLNRSSNLPDVIVITRGGGSLDDLAAFNDERVVRAVAASRVPTLVAIGHEVDVSLAELAADMRASTPTNAAQIAVPDRRTYLDLLDAEHKSLSGLAKNLYSIELERLDSQKTDLTHLVTTLLQDLKGQLASTAKLMTVFDPQAALKRGYAIVRKGQVFIRSINQVGLGDELGLKLQDGTIQAKVGGINREGNS